MTPTVDVLGVTYELRPVAHCRHCGQDRPHRTLPTLTALACLVCGTWRAR